MTIKLIKDFTYKEELFLPEYKKKNFSAIIFFDFYFKGHKIMSLPEFFYFCPWGSTRAELESIADEEIYFPFKYPSINHYMINKKYFYICFSFHSRSNSYKRVVLFFFLLQFFDLDQKECILKTCLPSIYEERKSFPFVFLNESFEKFAAFLERNVFDFVYRETIKVKSKILSSLEEEYGALVPLEGYHDEIPHQEIYSFLNSKDINFCSDVPSNIRIDLDAYFSDFFLLDFVKELESLGLAKNPFEAPIEESLIEYKKYLLSLYGPGKWEYTNLEIEKLNLTIEELLCLHIILCDDLGFLTLDLELNRKPKFFSTESPGNHGLYAEYAKVPYQYFWYRLREVLKKE